MKAGCFYLLPRLLPRLELLPDDDPRLELPEDTDDPLLELPLEILDPDERAGAEGRAWLLDGLEAGLAAGLLDAGRACCPVGRAAGRA